MVYLFEHCLLLVTYISGLKHEAIHHGCIIKAKKVEAGFVGINRKIYIPALSSAIMK